MKNFIRKRESFECSNCGEKVEGNGYTDHCPKCLWGKHVDLEIPGDRASGCGGAMEAIKTKYEGGDFRILYRCEECGHEFWVDCSKEDSRDRLAELING